MGKEGKEIRPTRREITREKNKFREVFNSNMKKFVEQQNFIVDKLDEIAASMRHLERKVNLCVPVLRHKELENIGDLNGPDTTETVQAEEDRILAELQELEQGSAARSDAEDDRQADP